VGAWTRARRCPAVSHPSSAGGIGSIGHVPVDPQRRAAPGLVGPSRTPCQTVAGNPDSVGPRRRLNPPVLATHRPDLRAPRPRPHHREERLGVAGVGIEARGVSGSSEPPRPPPTYSARSCRHRVHPLHVQVYDGPGPEPFAPGRPGPRPGHPPRPRSRDRFVRVQRSLRLRPRGRLPSPAGHLGGGRPVLLAHVEDGEAPAHVAERLPLPLPRGPGVARRRQVVARPSDRATPRASASMTPSPGYSRVSKPGTPRDSASSGAGTPGPGPSAPPAHADEKRTRRSAGSARRPRGGTGRCRGRGLSWLSFMARWPLHRSCPTPATGR
jgi:hypothetical protein